MIADTDSKCVQKILKFLIIALINDQQKFISAVSADKTIICTDGFQNGTEIGDQMVSGLMRSGFIDFAQIADGHQNTAHMRNLFRGIELTEDQVTAVSVGNSGEPVEIGETVQIMISLCKSL